MVNPSANKIILGSYPGLVSNLRSEYYSHPNNSFWTLLNIPTKDKDDNKISYIEKIKRLAEKDIGVWDVLSACSRLDKNNKETSLDKNISLQQYNNLEKLINKDLYFNGQTAFKEFSKIVKQQNLSFDLDKLQKHVLPSSSGLYRNNLDKRKEIWNNFFN